MKSRGLGLGDVRSGRRYESGTGIRRRINCKFCMYNHHTPATPFLPHAWTAPAPFYLLSKILEIFPLKKTPKQTNKQKNRKHLFVLTFWGLKIKICNFYLLILKVKNINWVKGNLENTNTKNTEWWILISDKVYFKIKSIK